MKVEIQRMDDRMGVIVIDGVNHAFVNALRRTLLADVPKLAIEDVTIYDNTSALFDEILSHRLGLLPVPSDPSAFNYREECPACEGEGCSNCTVLYTLSKEGPGTVYSGDLTPTDGRFAIPDDDIPLVKLLEGQRVMLEAAAILGTAGRHAKWAPVSGAGYRERPRVKIGKGSVPDAERVDFQRVMPKGAVTMDDQGRLEVVDEERAYDFLESVRDRFTLDFVELTEEPEAFIFRWETDGSLSPADALKHAIQLVMDRLKEVEDSVPDLVKQAA